MADDGGRTPDGSRTLVELVELGGESGVVKTKGWVCPECERRFGRRNQSHGCAPAITAEAYFANRPANDRKIYDAVARCFASRDVTVEVVGVGVLFKRVRTFAELRPRRTGMMLSFLLSRGVESERIAKVLKLSAHRLAYFVELAGPREVDRTVKAWLAEAYAASPSA